MAEIKLIDKVRQVLSQSQGRDIDLMQLRKELNIDPASPSWEGLRVILHRLCEGETPILRTTGRKDGTYHVITQVKPVSVFGSSRERRPPYILIFPKDRDTQLEMYPAEQVVVREGDMLLIAGRSNYGKTALCMNFLGENIDKHPVLMGNEYTVIGESGEFEPAPRFLSRLDNMKWIEWTNGDGMDKFTLLPVRDDYASHIQKDKINIIDWINVDTGEHYMIGTILEQIKRRLGKGIAIVAIQKAEGAAIGRGGQFTQDFADCELLIDALGKEEILLTMGKVKESKTRMYGKTYGYSLRHGVEVTNFREVGTCPQCKGKGWSMNQLCDKCKGKKYVDI